jgi:processive 1,2-diacylglycerol beta-glucosyltransferase
MKKTKILILTGDYGQGHWQAAQALCDYIVQYGGEAEPIIINYMQKIHPYLHPISHYGFKQTVKKVPAVYNYFYRKLHGGYPVTSCLTQLNRFGVERLGEILDELQPEMVISTFSLAAEAVSLLKEMGRTTVPSVTVVTDYTAHYTWAHPHTDYYLVGSETVREELSRFGVPAKKVFVTGIPVRPVFYYEYKKQELLKRHGLRSDLPTVLVMGGGWGLMNSCDISTLAKVEKPTQFIIVCGDNKKLRRQVAKAFHETKHHVLITGMVDCIHEFMAVSDMVLTKPGGITVSEAVAMKVPMLLYKPILEQEKANARLLVQLGVALTAGTYHDMAMQLDKMLDNQELLCAMQKNADRARKGEEPFQTLNHLLKVHTMWKQERSHSVSSNIELVVQVNG